MGARGGSLSRVVVYERTVERGGGGGGGGWTHTQLQLGFWEGDGAWLGVGTEASFLRNWLRRSKRSIKKEELFLPWTESALQIFTFFSSSCHSKSRSYVEGGGTDGDLANSAGARRVCLLRILLPTSVTRSDECVYHYGNKNKSLAHSLFPRGPSATMLGVFSTEME